MNYFNIKILITTIIKNNGETANIMNTFFSNIVINLDVPEYNDCEDISRNIYNPILKAIVKYKNHPSVKAIKYLSNDSNGLFSFDIVESEKILKEISSLDYTKVCQESDIPTNIFFSRLLLQTMNEVFHNFWNWLVLPQFL